MQVNAQSKRRPSSEYFAENHTLHEQTCMKKALHYLAMTFRALLTSAAVCSEKFPQWHLQLNEGSTRDCHWPMMSTNNNKPPICTSQNKIPALIKLQGSCLWKVPLSLWKRMSFLSPENSSPAGDLAAARPTPGGECCLRYWVEELW